MLLNTTIFNATVADAKAKCANDAYLLRAIDRAVYEINRSKYWSFADGVLRIQSTTSKKLYVVDDNHHCESRKVCKHRLARRLMQRYTERLAQIETKPEPQASNVPDGALIAPSLTMKAERWHGSAIEI